ncbi:MAG: hypothetical protein JXR51_13105 [Bacteroidales bacterium]|nr:hypothetical protein [Bacteroidales bacterium]MBN2758109.1 hypothetical protein [Bacteroidales bacterium]
MSINIIYRNIIRFFILIFLQIFIFNNINVTSFGIIPFVYILYIILSPFETPNWLLLITAFFLGLLIDIFSDTLGLNSSASVLIAFIRPWILNSLSPRDGYEVSTFPRIYYQGLVWFIKYAAILILFHQIAYYFLDAFGFDNLGLTLIKVIIGSFITLSIIVLSQYIVYRK